MFDQHLNASERLFRVRRWLARFEDGETLTREEAGQMSRYLKELGVAVIRMEHQLMQLGWAVTRGDFDRLQAIVVMEANKPGSNVIPVGFERPFSDGNPRQGGSA